MDNFFSNISRHTENLGRKRLLESVSPPPTTNKKEKVNEAEEAAHVGSEQRDHFEAPQPENQNNPIPVLGTSKRRIYYPWSAVDDNGELEWEWELETNNQKEKI